MDLIPSFKSRINKNYSPEDEEDFWKWIESVDTTIGLLGSRPRHASTYRVPSKLRAMKPEAYTPLMVSIGPFHRQKPELRAMEELKWIYMLNFVDRLVIPATENTQSNKPSSSASPRMLALIQCSKLISEVEEEARAWYAEDIDLDKHRLVEMLLVDGCFILELFYRCSKVGAQKFEEEYFRHPLESKYKLEPLAGNFSMVQTLTHDLLLLENQIPYFVLQKLFDLISSSPIASSETYAGQMSLEDYVFWFFDSVPILRYDKLMVMDDEDRSYNHLLDMLHHACKQNFNRYMGYPVLISDSKIWGFKRCATKLFSSGIKFTSRSGIMTNVEFTDGTLVIPQVIIHKSGDTILRNLMALEQTGGCRNCVTSYVRLMSTLIHSPEDAKLLERLDIISKSDEVVEDISTFFKTLCSQVEIIDFTYSDLCDKVENHHIPFWRRSRVKGYLGIKYFEWKASFKDLQRDYFTTRWSVAVFLAASFVIILGILQTFYTVRAYYPPYH